MQMVYYFVHQRRLGRELVFMSLRVIEGNLLILVGDIIYESCDVDKNIRLKESQLLQTIYFQSYLRKKKQNNPYNEVIHIP